MKSKTLSVIALLVISSIATAQKQKKINSDQINVKANIWETKENGVGDFFPNFTIDGDLSSKSSWRGERIEGTKPWIQYNLGNPTNISFINLAFFSGNKRNYFFEIAISKDGEHWKSVFNGQSNGTTLDFEKFEINEKKVRYLKITGNGNNHDIYFNWTNITEIEIYKS